MVPQTGPQMGELRVLVIEDEGLIRMALAEELRNVGLTIVETENADEAWSYLQAGGQADLIFSDICMPGSMDGIELARRVKKYYPGLEIILTSGNLQKLQEAGLGRLLRKPYQFGAAVKFVLETLKLTDSRLTNDNG
jgi:CheY-like chemotaxis protein